MNAGDVISVVLDGVTNPTTTGTATTTVSTTSDTKTTTKAFTVTATQAVSGLTVTPLTTAAAAQADWTIGFTTSSSGALEYPDSTVTVTLPAGTALGSFNGATLTDTTSGNPLSNSCSNGSGTTVTCTLNQGYGTNAGDVLSVQLVRRDQPQLHRVGQHHGVDLVGHRYRLRSPSPSPRPSRCRV